ncbi:MAG: ABC transporter permease, partial [Candidatus Kapabacteria bacterium]|nr:ABC transporter permease [Candidatus Kapabacteria bacterium]
MSITTGESPSRLAWRRLRKNRGAVIGMIVLGIMVIMAIFAPFVT